MVLRKPLRTRTGCVRCRQRRVKCDETHPRCTFCARWNYNCVRPLHDDHDRQQQPNHSVVSDVVTSRNTSPVITAGRLVLLREPERCGKSLDAFHSLPVDEGTISDAIVDILRFFFVTMMNAAIPFNISPTKQTLAADWMEMIFADQAVCWAFAAYCAESRARWTLQDIVQDTDPQFGARASALLRRRIETGSYASEGTLLASAVHFVWAALDSRNIHRIPILHRGVEHLVTARGGFQSVEHEAKPGTVQSVIISDTLSSYITASPPRYRRTLNMCQPISLSIVNDHRVGRSAVEAVIDSRLADLLHMVDVVLFFRAPSKWIHALAGAEARYVTSLLGHIDHELGTLQALFLESQSISEIIILGLILVKQTIISERAQHRVLIDLVITRLRSAITMCQNRTTKTYMSAAVWASVVAFASCATNSDGLWFLTFAASFLNARYREQEWDLLWKDHLRSELSEILWHGRIETTYEAFCRELSSQCCQSTSSWTQTLILKVSHTPVG